MANKKKWSELSGVQRAFIVVGLAAQLSLQGVALADLRRRPSDEVRGRKVWWLAASFVNFVGPITYMVCGRR